MPLPHDFPFAAAAAPKSNRSLPDGDANAADLGLVVSDEKTETQQSSDFGMRRSPTTVG